MLKSLVFSFIVSFLLCGTLYANEETLVQVTSRPGIEQKFLLVKPDKPTAAVILFAGGHGGLQLSSFFGKPGMAWGKVNFLVRTRKQFADHGFLVAVIDSPSDHQKMDANWRISSDHVKDIDAVIKYLRSNFNLPVWVIGTSRGTYSASNAAIQLGTEIQGLVLTSSITHSAKNSDIYSSHPNGIMNMDLGKISVPTLITVHKDDACVYTPATNAEKLKVAISNAPKVEVKYFSGGKRPESRPCQAKSEHGYFGIEDIVVAAIADFIRAN
jgi:pimeloyl-ACP methyl ester carboxylesterase